MTTGPGQESNDDRSWPGQRNGAQRPRQPLCACVRVCVCVHVCVRMCIRPGVERRDRRGRRPRWLPAADAAR